MEPDASLLPRLIGFLERFDCAALPPADLADALVHRSHAYEENLGHDNERLEFLGDALIGAIASEVLFEADAAADEGALSKRRSRLVSRAALGRRAIEMGVGDIILLGRGERDTGGSRRRSILGSALEAIVAVVYLRLGYAHARDFVRRHILESILKHLGSGAIGEDYKSALQEYTQHCSHIVPHYRLVGEHGPDHAKVFSVVVELDGRALAEGAGSRIKLAENEAARLALAILKEEADARDND
jgi:ribonuclease-3